MNLIAFGCCSSSQSAIISSDGCCYCTSHSPLLSRLKSTAINDDAGRPSQVSVCSVSLNSSTNKSENCKPYLHSDHGQDHQGSRDSPILEGHQEFQREQTKGNASTKKEKVRTRSSNQKTKPIKKTKRIIKTSRTEDQANLLLVDRQRQKKSVRGKSEKGTKETKQDKQEKQEKQNEMIYVLVFHSDSF